MMWTTEILRISILKDFLPIPQYWTVSKHKSAIWPDMEYLKNIYLVSILHKGPIPLSTMDNKTSSMQSIQLSIICALHEGVTG